MSTEAVIESTILEPTGGSVVPYVPAEQLALARPPDIVLREASIAAQALKKVIDSKDKKVVFNGKTYLVFEDWQTVGRFYGITAKVVEVRPIDMGEVTGFSARAVALRSDGEEIGGAEAMCLSDEPNWKSKPLFQLASMAQTRAAAKALRGVLSWVVVMAGYEPTPAEEMMETRPPVQQPHRASEGMTPTEAAAQRAFEDTATAAPPAVKVTGCKKVKSGESDRGPWSLFAVQTSDGKKFITFSLSIYAACQKALAEGYGVVITAAAAQEGKDPVIEEVTRV